ncbi:uncharacterized protein LOC143564380, partial [Bidens hawaiensis]|uniref:uncharacterized protein LOC143564380 n=1 Tax=Bidens hawaiensis TaxID=980011 RepID=UPI00404B9EF7
MSLENEGDSSVMVAAGSVIESEKKSRILYTRDFLLSFSELEVCKSLRSGFDRTILREFEENSIQERARTHGNLPLQGSRRNNDYSSSPPTRGDSSSFSQYGRWDGRASGRNDKDGDAQSDVDPDPGRRNYGNQSRRPWQNSEHDGLLGSGSFPRPTRSAGGTSASKGPSATNEHYHLNKSTGAYQPPRPFKVVPHSRPNTHDSFNDETFGSIESTSEDRSEEERKRRASFELMRKEQQKVLQEKQKTSASKVKNDDFTDLILEEIKEEGVPKDDSGKSDLLLQPSKPRPLVPPGFNSTVLEKSSTTKLIPSTEKEQSTKPGLEEILLLAKGNHTQNETLDNKGSIHSVDHHPNRISGFPELHEAVDGEVFELATNKISNSNQENTTSILGRLFGSGPTNKDGGPTGFPEIIISFWVRSRALNQMIPRVPAMFNLPDLLSGLMKTNMWMASAVTKPPSDPKQLFNNFRHESAPPPVAAVLTCEDLEQTIMSEYSEKSSNCLPPVPDWTVSGQENADARPVDSQATHHLLSLLHKGPTINDVPSLNVGPVVPVEAHPGNNQVVANSGQNLSLEALFGAAFMKELQSAQAPVSVPRAPPGSDRIDVYKPHDSSLSNVNGMGPIVNQPAKLDDPESWLQLNGQQVKVEPNEIHLPEEQSLIIAGNAVNTHNSNTGKMLPADVAFDISEKLAVLNTGFGARGPYDMLQPERQFNNNQYQRPAFHPSDSNPHHMNSQMSFLDQIMQLE